MKREALRERMELLEIGEAMGYPRLGYGRSTKIPHDKRIPRGKAGWEKFCAHAHVDRVLPALRIGRVLREHGVTMYNPVAVREVMPNERAGSDVRPSHDMTAEAPALPSSAPDDLTAGFEEFIA